MWVFLHHVTVINTWPTLGSLHVAKHHEIMSRSGRTVIVTRWSFWRHSDARFVFWPQDRFCQDKHSHTALSCPSMELSQKKSQFCRPIVFLELTLVPFKQRKRGVWTLKDKKATKPHRTDQKGLSQRHKVIFSFSHCKQSRCTFLCLCLFSFPKTASLKIDLLSRQKLILPKGGPN